jgi:hypothetical protein
MNAKEPTAAERTTGPVIEELPLVLSDADLEGVQRAQIIAAQRGERVLGGGSGDAERALFDALPGVIARRIQAITPKDFGIKSLTLTMKLGGAVCGIGVSGDVTVTLAPKSTLAAKD